ncbi:MAG: hypothetical protein PHP06_03525 [Clostridia bacterium]|nr:hypothetical protein [Clostridia bacterium]
MVKVFLGKKGIGKTKKLIEMANTSVDKCDGGIIYLDDDSRHIYDLNYNVRFINTKEFDINDSKEFYGFICGIISANYDVRKIFIDGLINIVSEDLKDLKGFFDGLKKLSKKFTVDFIIVINADPEEVPDFLNV